VQANYEYIHKSETANIEAEILMCCETKSEKKRIRIIADGR